MLDVEAILEEAGARWRASQPPAPWIEIESVLADVDRSNDSGRRFLRLWPAGVALAVVAAVGIGFLMSVRPSQPSGGLSQASVPAATPAGRDACHVTLPNPAFVAPSPFLTEDPTPSHAWFGTEHMWASLDIAGESWGPPAPGRSMPIPQKTFWWSVDWSPRTEPAPAISVTGTRLDGAGTFEFSPGTNASAEFGTAMLVGIDIPAAGCWEITGRYKGAELSYVVWVQGD